MEQRMKVLKTVLICLILSQACHAYYLVDVRTQNQTISADSGDYIDMGTTGFISEGGKKADAWGRCYLDSYFTFPGIYTEYGYYIYEHDGTVNLNAEVEGEAYAYASAGASEYDSNYAYAYAKARASMCHPRPPIAVASAIATESYANGDVSGYYSGYWFASTTTGPYARYRTFEIDPDPTIGIGILGAANVQDCKGTTEDNAEATAHAWARVDVEIVEVP